MTRIKTSLVLAIALSVPAVAVAGPGSGPEKKEVKKAEPIRLNDAEIATLRHHHGVNQMEIDMGKVAQQRGGPSVKKYAAMLVKDHQKADKTAVGLAKVRGVSLTGYEAPMTDAEMAEHNKQMETADRLKKLDGDDFDREYLETMAAGHTAEAAYLTMAIAGTSDAKLKAHLEAVKPVVEKHAQEARALLEARAQTDLTPPPAP